MVVTLQVQDRAGNVSNPLQQTIDLSPTASAAIDRRRRPLVIGRCPAGDEPSVGAPKSDRIASYTRRLAPVSARVGSRASPLHPQLFVSDLIAGVTVGLVALPLAMAFAISSGMTPQAGIYCAIVTGFIISALGGSHVQIGGPTGAFVVVVAGIVAQYGIDGLFMCTMMAGVVLVDHGRDRHRDRGAVHSAAGRHRFHQRHRAGHRQHAAQGLFRHHAVDAVPGEFVGADRGARDARCTASLPTTLARRRRAGAHHRVEPARAARARLHRGAGRPAPLSWRCCGTAASRRSAAASAAFQPACRRSTSRDSGPTWS